MKKQFDIKKLVLLNLPYLLMGLFATNFGEAWRLAQGADASEKFLSLFCCPAWGAAKFLAQPAPVGSAGGRCAAVLACGWRCISKARTPRSTGTAWSMAPPVGEAREDIAPVHRPGIPEQCDSDQNGDA